MNSSWLAKQRSFTLVVALCVAAATTASARSSRADISIRKSGEHGVRITLGDAEGELKLNPALVDQSLPEPALRLKAGETKSKEKVGDVIVTVTANPVHVRIEDALGRKVQELEFAEAAEQSSFMLGEGPVLGLGGATV